MLKIVKLTQVDPGSPAEAAGLRPGDRILEVDRQRVNSADEFRAMVLAAASPAEISILRDGEPGARKLRVQLTGDPLRYGISWRTDDGEPGTVILNRVAAGSPAHQAGLRVGDRIYAIDSKLFANETELRKTLNEAQGALNLVVERRGVIQKLELKPVPTAARP
jgi:S1-C subfamily serine protease